MLDEKLDSIGAIDLIEYNDVSSFNNSYSNTNEGSSTEGV